MLVQVITLFPDEFRPLVDLGVTGRAIRDGRVRVETVNPRDFATDRHRTVDDRPYGGGPGMVMMVEPLMAAIDAARQSIDVQTFGMISPLTWTAVTAICSVAASPWPHALSVSPVTMIDADTSPFTTSSTAMRLSVDDPEKSGCWSTTVPMKARSLASR